MNAWSLCPGEEVLPRDGLGEMAGVFGGHWLGNLAEKRQKRRSYHPRGNASIQGHHHTSDASHGNSYRSLRPLSLSLQMGNGLVCSWVTWEMWTACRKKIVGGKRATGKSQENWQKCKKWEQFLKYRDFHHSPTATRRDFGPLILEEEGQSSVINK